MDTDQHAETLRNLSRETRARRYYRPWGQEPRSVLVTIRVTANERAAINAAAARENQTTAEFIRAAIAAHASRRRKATRPAAGSGPAA